MDCPNCHFHNMPGTAACGRCGTSLKLGEQALDVHPPRAGAISLRLRRWFPLGSTYYAWRDRVDATRIKSPLSGLMDDAPNWMTILRMVLPGWGQWLLGERRIAKVFFFAWLGFILLGLLFFGTTRGSLLLGIAFSIHSFAAADLFNRHADRSFRAQLPRSIFISIVLAMLVYAPASYLLTRVFDPITPLYPIGPYAQGSTFAVNHWATPDRGSVVLYDVPAYEGKAQMQQHKQVIGYSGQRIDRVLAVAGDTIECRGGVVLVNGKVSEHAPLVTIRPPDLAPLEVSEGRVFILPSTAKDLTFANADPGLLGVMSIVPVESIRGVVYAKIHPLTQFRLIY